MADDADQLLDAIWADPDNVAPRLVYADGLEEHGYPDYARYIRLSCRLRLHVLPRDERAALRRERFEIGKEIVRANPLTFDGGHYGLSRMVEGIPDRWQTVDADGFLRRWPHWWPFIRPRGLTLLDVCGHEAAVARCEYLRQIEGLYLEGRADGMYYDERWREHVNWHPVAGALLGELAASPMPVRLRVLRVQPILATAGELDAFAHSPLVGRLTGLWLWVQFADGEREELEADGGFIRDALTEFLVEHGHRLPRDPAPPG